MLSRTCFQQNHHHDSVSHLKPTCKYIKHDKNTNTHTVEILLCVCDGQLSSLCSECDPTKGHAPLPPAPAVAGPHGTVRWPRRDTTEAVPERCTLLLPLEAPPPDDDLCCLPSFDGPSPSLPIPHIFGSCDAPCDPVSCWWFDCPSLWDPGSATRRDSAVPPCLTRR